MIFAKDKDIEPQNRSSQSHVILFFRKKKIINLDSLLFNLKPLLLNPPKTNQLWEKTYHLQSGNVKISKTCNIFLKSSL